jgi:hypothetical protein
VRVLVDTSVWSLALRRRKSATRTAADLAVTAELAELVRERRVDLIGPVRQELLSGVRLQPHFEALRDALRAFPDLPLASEDYEHAAEIMNLCCAHGLQGSNSDFLICAVIDRRGSALFTTDRDFERFAQVLPLRLHTPRSATPPSPAGPA